MKNKLSLLFALMVIAGFLQVGFGQITYSVVGDTVTVTDCLDSASGELIIPSVYNGNPVTAIGDSAFFYCASLTSVTIPHSVTSIGMNAFAHCPSLTNIEVVKSNSEYSSQNGVLFNKYKKKLIQYPEGKTGDQYTIPNSVINIRFINIINNLL